MNLFENPDDAACFRFLQLLGVEPSIMTLYLITCQPRGSLASNWFKNQSEAEPSIMTPIPSRCQHPFDNFFCCARKPLPHQAKLRSPSSLHEPQCLGSFWIIVMSASGVMVFACLLCEVGLFERPLASLLLCEHVVTAQGLAKTCALATLRLQTRAPSFVR